MAVVNYLLDNGIRVYGKKTLNCHNNYITSTDTRIMSRSFVKRPKVVTVTEKMSDANHININGFRIRTKEINFHSLLSILKYRMVET